MTLRFSKAWFLLAGILFLTLIFHAAAEASDQKGFHLFVFKNPLEEDNKGIEIGIIKGNGDGDYTGWALVFEQYKKDWSGVLGETASGETWDEGSGELSGKLVGIRYIYGTPFLRPVYSGGLFGGVGVEFTKLEGTYLYDNPQRTGRVSTNLTAPYIEGGVRCTLGPVGNKGGGGITVQGKVIFQYCLEKTVNDGYADHKYGGSRNVGFGAMLNIGLSFWVFGG